MAMELLRSRVLHSSSSSLFSPKSWMRPFQGKHHRSFLSLAVSFTFPRLFSSLAHSNFPNSLRLTCTPSTRWIPASFRDNFLLHTQFLDSATRIFRQFLSLSLSRSLETRGSVASSRLQTTRTKATEKSKRIVVPRKKRRLDEVCLERYQQYSRTFIQSWILQGKVFVDGRVVNKAGTLVSGESTVEIKAEVPKYVCRAGYKLEAAIEKLNVDVSEKVALDSGLSTGGFTDCLLQHGASFVYGVDVGYGQVADKIRNDERVCVMERTNLRYLPGLPQRVDLVTLDLSFISILTVMPAVITAMKEQSTLVTLIKPQFEARRSQVGGGGVVRDPQVHQEVLERITKGVEALGFFREGWIESPLKGAEGNTEFLACFRRT